jgi:large subunit ribosomal protein L25
MSDIELHASIRSAVGKGLFALRKSGKIPAILYGPGVDTLPIELEGQTAGRVLNTLTGSTLIQLEVNQKKYSVLLRDLQRDSVLRTIQHADFYAVPTGRAIRVHVPLQFSGESAAVRDFGGVLVHLLSELEVECLPKDLVSGIPVSLSPLEKVGDSIAIKDILLPPGIKVLMDLEESIITVAAQAAEEEVVAPVAAAVPAEVEVIEKGKKLEEEAEGTEKETREPKETKKPQETKKPPEAKKP